MTVVRRRAKPQSTEPWPSYAEPEARVTSEGQVSSLPSPVQAMWAEAVGRVQLEQSWTSNEAEGLCVALAILTCDTVEDVRAEVQRRASAAGRQR